MPAQLLTIEVDRLDAGRVRLRLAGELDFDTAPELIAAAADVRRDDCQDLVIDLTGVALCDSSGLSALVVVHRSDIVRLTGVGPQLASLLDRTGLTELLGVERPAEGGMRAAG
ncbi:STAS domain-containing protein [Micromonospora echinaurantiaca]|uniref:STAS domain-containing protein n=1 Tax=Micromonospora echinaurantiaca TaxID=47857 RepID=UPI003420D252